jgi:hypothetical protein
MNDETVAESRTCISALFEQHTALMAAGTLARLLVEKSGPQDLPAGMSEAATRWLSRFGPLAEAAALDGATARALHAKWQPVGLGAPDSESRRMTQVDSTRTIDELAHRREAMPDDSEYITYLERTVESLARRLTVRFAETEALRGALFTADQILRQVHEGLESGEADAATWRHQMMVAATNWRTQHRPKLATTEGLEITVEDDDDPDDTPTETEYQVTEHVRDN